MQVVSTERAAIFISITDRSQEMDIDQADLIPCRRIWTVCPSISFEAALWHSNRALNPLPLSLCAALRSKD